MGARSVLSITKTPSADAPKSKNEGNFRQRVGFDWKQTPIRKKKEGVSKGET